MKSKSIYICEFKVEFSKYAREVLKWVSLIISMPNKPFAEGSPLEVMEGGEIKFGVLKGKFKGFKVPHNFNDACPNFEDDY